MEHADWAGISEAKIERQRPVEMTLLRSTHRSAARAPSLRRRKHGCRGVSKAAVKKKELPGSWKKSYGRTLAGLDDSNYPTAIGKSPWQRLVAMRKPECLLVNGRESYVAWQVASCMTSALNRGRDPDADPN